MRMLDLFCGRFGWGRAFAARGWDVVGFDLVKPPEIPARCCFVQQDILELTLDRGFLDFWEPDFICASSPCEQFSCHCLPWFVGRAPHPELGIRLFNHTRVICEASGIPYVMENVRCAQQFVGEAVSRCGPFYLWGNGIPPLMPQGIYKHTKILGGHNYTKELRRAQHDRIMSRDGNQRESTARTATIPPELANCVAEYAERLLEVAA